MEIYREPFTEAEKSELLAKAQQKVNEIFDIEGLGAIIFAGEGSEGGGTTYAGNITQLINICARVLSHCYVHGGCKTPAEDFMGQFSEHTIRMIGDDLVTTQHN
jgi:hypothetical protein